MVSRSRSARGARPSSSIREPGPSPLGSAGRTSVPLSHVQLRLRAVRSSLTPAGRKLCDFIIAHPEQPLHLTISELATAAGVSDATVTRLCQSVGYHGFAEFRLLLARDRPSADPRKIVELTPADSAAEICEQLVAASIAALDETRRVLDAQALRTTAGAILRARRVEVYGIGGSAVVAMDIRHKLLRLGIPIASHCDVDIMAISAATLSADDVAIGVSHTGRSEPTVMAVQRARLGGAFTVALTQSAASPLAATSDQVLTYAARPTPFSSDSPIGRLAQLVVIDVLYATIVNATYERSAHLVEQVNTLADARRLSGDPASPPSPSGAAASGACGP